MTDGISLDVMRCVNIAQYAIQYAQKMCQSHYKGTSLVTWSKL